MHLDRLLGGSAMYVRGFLQTEEVSYLRLTSAWSGIWQERSSELCKPSPCRRRHLERLVAGVRKQRPAVHWVQVHAVAIGEAEDDGEVIREVHHALHVASRLRLIQKSGESRRLGNLVAQHCGHVRVQRGVVETENRGLGRARHWNRVAQFPHRLLVVGVADRVVRG